MTSEYTSGMIRATLTATPNRPLLLAAKAAVFGATALIVGEAAAFIAFITGGATLPDAIRAPALGHPGVLRAVLMSGAAFCLIGMLGLGLGAIIRHTPAAIAVLVGVVFVVAQFLSALSHAVLAYLPISIVGNSLAITQDVDGMLSPWAGLGVLCLYAVTALAIGGWLLTRRDA